MPPKGDQPGKAKRAQKISYKGEVESRHQADALLTRPGDVVLVKRGVPRSLVFACPDGCGKALTINLDKRTGKAWRLYQSDQDLTLFPSVWRDEGCGAHFILWRNQVRWCDWSWQDLPRPKPDESLVSRVLQILKHQPQTAVAIAEELSAIPYEVEIAADLLVARGQADRFGKIPVTYAKARPRPQPIKPENSIEEAQASGRKGWLKTLIDRLLS